MKSAMMKALGEPNRLQIVELLRSGPLTVGEIAKSLGIRQPQASKHLRILSEAGILEVEAVTNKRIYKLRQEPFQELDDWLTSIQHVWEEKLDRLDEYLEELQSKKMDQEEKP